MVRYYGYYSNVSRRKRQKENQDGLIPYILELGGSSKEYRKNWARLIHINDGEIIKKILKYLGLWKVKARPPAKANANILCVAKPWFNT